MHSIQILALGNSKHYYYYKIVLTGKSEYSDWFSLSQYRFCHAYSIETVMQLWYMSALQ